MPWDPFAEGGGLAIPPNVRLQQTHRTLRPWLGSEMRYGKMRILANRDCQVITLFVKFNNAIWIGLPNSGSARLVYEVVTDERANWRGIR
jgi:hypothetical protein